MKNFLTAFLAMFVCSLAQPAQRAPYPPSVIQADDAVRAGMKVEPPMVKPQHTVDVAKLQREAEELNRLSSLVEKEVAMANKGELAGDLPKNLKEIEKLAHQLRSQLSR